MEPKLSNLLLTCQKSAWTQTDVGECGATKAAPRTPNIGDSFLFYNICIEARRPTRIKICIGATTTCIYRKEGTKRNRKVIKINDESFWEKL